MTAIQILDKLGANASFNPSHLSEEDKLIIQQALGDTQTYNAILNQSPPDEEETPDEDQDDDSDDEKKSCSLDFKPQ